MCYDERETRHFRIIEKAKELMREKHQKAFPLIFDKCITVISSTKPMQERESGQRDDDMGAVRYLGLTTCSVFEKETESWRLTKAKPRPFESCLSCMPRINTA